MKTLQEILKENNLSDETIKSINGAVDVIIAGKTETLTANLKKVQGDLDLANNELTPFKAEVRTKKINSLVGKLTENSKLNDAISLAKLTDDDTDEEIVNKVKGVIEARPYLQPVAVSDESAKKTLTEKSSNITTVDEIKTKTDPYEGL